jgi:fatty acid/phospholipid biosynthesis enzyme
MDYEAEAEHLRGLVKERGEELEQAKADAEMLRGRLERLQVLLEAEEADGSLVVGIQRVREVALG